MLRGLNTNSNLDEIKKYINDLNISDVKIEQIIRMTTKKSVSEGKILPIFIVQADSKISSIVKIKHIDHQIVLWEKLKKI